MARRSSIEIAKPEILALFEEGPRSVFRKRDLTDILSENRDRWRLGQSLTTPGFMEFLSDYGKLHGVTLKSKDYDDVHRYCWGDVTPFEIAQSVKSHGYFSHGTAVFLHALTEELPKTLYLNSEQSPKPQGGSLTQGRLDQAFARSPRQSRYILTWDDYRLVLINGKWTDQLEVGQIEGPGGEILDLTKLERTLIDITVRPVYAGGVFKVLEAFEAAKDRVSVNTLVATLRKLDYLYPYHQAIGFYMTRAGYDIQRLKPLRKLPIEFDFHLVHGTKERDFDPEWRLFFPKGF